MTSLKSPPPSLATPLTGEGGLQRGYRNLPPISPWTYKWKIALVLPWVFCPTVKPRGLSMENAHTFPRTSLSPVQKTVQMHFQNYISSGAYSTLKFTFLPSWISPGAIDGGGGGLIDGKLREGGGVRNWSNTCTSRAFYTFIVNSEWIHNGFIKNEDFELTITGRAADHK